ncbi:MAG TPA: biotin--[acetyl-CoA-carboxylase] ligase [Spirochaetota bacterium]|nr:biotin--[acetyl-CoA-carboxylase] ligase [Spirochaetota bacterium]HPJ34234.1 biotin--[acetyl-CoA-carboxylase] ligase [Spirochaetota bacterium]
MNTRRLNTFDEQETVISENNSSDGYSFNPYQAYVFPDDVHVDWYKELGSTNDLAIEYAKRDLKHSAVIVADHQTCGKGRFDRIWHSPEGKGLWFSIVKPFEYDLANVPQVTLIAAVAVAEVLKNNTGLDIGIKWPNDLLINNRKVCGILSELAPGSDIDNVYVIVGIGINVNMSSDDMSAEIKEKSTSLLMESGSELDRKKLLSDIIESFNKWFNIWLSNGFHEIREQWIKHNVTIGRMLEVNLWDEYYCGQAVGMDQSGSLEILDSNNVVRKINSGEVSLIFN